MRNKSLLLFAMWMVFNTILSAQQPCTSPMPTARFKQKLDQISALRNENQRLLKAKETAKENCMSCEQVKQFAGLFASDYNRLDFAMGAFPNTIDKENFYDVYDAFAYFSNVMRLHDFVRTYQPISPPPLPPQTQLNFPNYNYPAYQHYQGNASCQPPLSEQDFFPLAIEVNNQNSEAGRLMLMTQLSQVNCLSAAQVMKMASLLSAENNRLTYVKNAYLNTYDIGNYPALTQLFMHVPYQQSLMEFIGQASTSPEPPVPPPCILSPEDFTQVKESINKQKFNSTKVTIAKQVITAKKCFNTLQIKEILKLFSFEESKLELAKFAYDFCTDKQNYFSVNDVFSFSSSIDALNTYIQGKH